MNLIEKVFCFPSFSTLRFLFVITLIQMWWIAVWGLAYIAIEQIAGKSKRIEFLTYISLLIATAIIIHAEPTLLERL